MFSHLCYICASDKNMSSSLALHIVFVTSLVWGIQDNKSAGGLLGNGNISLFFIFCVWPEKINIFLPMQCRESDKKSFYFTLMTPQTFVSFPGFGETLTEFKLLLSLHCSIFLWNFKEKARTIFQTFNLFIISGARRQEIALMNGLTVNLHLLMVCLYDVYLILCWQVFFSLLCVCVSKVFSEHLMETALGDRLSF